MSMVVAADGTTMNCGLSNKHCVDAVIGVTLGAHAKRRPANKVRRPCQRRRVEGLSVRAKMCLPLPFNNSSNAACAARRALGDAVPEMMKHVLQAEMRPNCLRKAL